MTKAARCQEAYRDCTEVTHKGNWQSDSHQATKSALQLVLLHLSTALPRQLISTLVIRLRVTQLAQPGQSMCLCGSARDPFVSAAFLAEVPSRCLCTSYPFLGGLGDGKAFRSSCSQTFVKPYVSAPSPTHLYARTGGMLTCITLDSMLMIYCSLKCSSTAMKGTQYPWIAVMSCRSMTYA